MYVKVVIIYFLFTDGINVYIQVIKIYILNADVIYSYNLGVARMSLRMSLSSPFFDSTKCLIFASATENIFE